jgi:hypothetical protein
VRVRFVCAVVLFSACVPGGIDLNDRRCPCAEGWTCVDDVCVEGVPLDGGRELDAGMAVDAGRRIDAGMSDAATTLDGGRDAGMSDAGPDSTSCDDVHADALFCDGLEDETLAAWDSFFEHNGTIARTEERAYRGEGSLRSEITGSGGYVTARFAIGALMSGQINVRGYFYVPSTVDISMGLSIIQAGYDSDPWYHASLNIDEPSTSSVFVRTDADNDWDDGGTIPRDAWFCAELRVSISDTAGSVELWVDGVRTAMLSGIDTLPSRGYERFVVGIPYTELTQTSALVYTDEVVYDDEPIGCD